MPCLLLRNAGLIPWLASAAGGACAAALQAEAHAPAMRRGAASAAAARPSRAARDAADAVDALTAVVRFASDKVH